jgi:hypothetical protein
MTISIAVDNTNVTELPVGNLRDVAGMARRFAEQVDAGQYGGIARAICLIECEGGMPILVWGDETSHYELMGILEAAKLRVFADDLIDDD